MNANEPSGRLSGFSRAKRATAANEATSTSGEKPEFGSTLPGPSQLRRRHAEPAAPPAPVDDIEAVPTAPQRTPQEQSHPRVQPVRNHRPAATQPRSRPGGGVTAKDLLADLNRESLGQRLLSHLVAEGIDVQLIESAPEGGYTRLRLRAPHEFLRRILESATGFLNSSDLPVELDQGDVLLWVPNDHGAAKTRTSITLPASLIERARIYKDASGVPKAVQYIECVEASLGDLPTLFPDTYDENAEARTIRRDARKILMGTEYVSLTSPQDAVVADALRRSGAGSRSALIERCLDKYLQARGY